MSKEAKGTHDYLDDPRNSEVLVYVNGKYFPRQDAKISVFDSGFLLGDGVWEGRGRLGEALRELSFLKTRQDLELSSVVALLFFHRLAENIDYEEIEILSNLAARATERASEPSLLLCAQFHLYAGIHATSNERLCEQFKASRSLIRKA